MFSLGGVQPVLRQLERDGLLVRSDEGKRRRRAMVVTEKGEAILAAHWHGCLDLHWDVESVLRAATVALLMDDPRVTSSYLLNMAYEYDRKSSGSRTGDPDDRASIVEWYGYMRAHCETSRLQSAAQALRAIAKTIESSIKVQSRRNEPQAELWKEQRRPIRIRLIPELRGRPLSNQHDSADRLPVLQAETLRRHSRAGGTRFH
jgi:DNA-binding PadR family transcriptional regulator